MVATWSGFDLYEGAAAMSDVSLFERVLGLISIESLEDVILLGIF